MNDEKETYLASALLIKQRKEYRKKRVAKFMADGLTYMEIAKNLNMHQATVRTLAIELGLHVPIKRKMAR